jgi:hypothetical protein
MKTPKKPFSYVVLRYMHDVFTREFVNVGVLFYSPQSQFLRLRKLSTLERVKGMFPGLQSDSLRDLLKFIESRTEELRGKAFDGLDWELLTADAIAKSLLTTDDSALQWSTTGGGVTDNPEQTLSDLFDRLVIRHQKAHPVVRREDVDVWKPFEGEFRRRHILHKFQEKTLVVGELKHRFQISWQPDRSFLRLFQPLSFDLLEPSGIVEKAVHWSALIRQLRKADPDFYIYLLIGKPLEKGQVRAFEQAYHTLNEEGSDRKKLIDEQEVVTFAEDVEKEIKATPNNN